MQMAMSIAGVLLLAFFFAQVEIQIEGSAGWASSLPTWRIEEHWMLDAFWGSRAMTGYHAWTFPFIALFFHFPLFFAGHFSLAALLRSWACIMLFWVCEDFLWFVMNPDYGFAAFSPQRAVWHKHWIAGAPVDYWIFLPLSLLLIWQSWRLAEKSSRKMRV